MAEIKLLTSPTKVNTYLLLLGEMYNVYRVDLTTGIVRISNAKEQQDRLVTIEHPKKFGVTTDGVTCEIACVMTKDEVRKVLDEEMFKEVRHYSTGLEITTDGYYPGVTTDGRAGIGVRKDSQGQWEMFKLIRRIHATYEPLITDQCYFSEAFRLLMPIPVLLEHLVKHLGWIADPYDWQKFEFGDKRQWIELPSMRE